MKTLFNEKEKEFLIKNMKGLWARDLVVLFNKEFNRDITMRQLQNWRENHKLKSDVYDIWNKEEEEFLLKECPNHMVKEVVEMFKEKFNKETTINQITVFKKKHNIKTDGRFKKGQSSYNTKPIGTETIVYEKDKKQVFVKVGENHWERKQKYIYEQHYGKLPEDSIIMFLDGDRDNFDIKNLIALTRHESNIMAGMNIFTKNKEINKTAIELSRLKAKAKEMEEC